jgi:hypothetical protein
LIYEFGEFQFEPANARLSAILLHAEPKALRVLEVLLDGKGSLVDRDTLLTLVRGRVIVTPGTLTRLIASSFAPLGLRLAIEEASGRWGIALIGRNVTNDVSADFAGPTPDKTQPPSASPAGLRSVLLSGWFRR